MEFAIMDFRFLLDQLREMHLRRYNLRSTALEFFLANNTNYFINFDPGVRDKVFKRILAMKPPNLVRGGWHTPAQLLALSGLTERWRRRQLSNFDYLMQLNTIAGTILCVRCLELLESCSLTGSYTAFLYPVKQAAATTT